MTIAYKLRYRDNLFLSLPNEDDLVGDNYFFRNIIKHYPLATRMKIARGAAGFDAALFDQDGNGPIRMVRGLQRSGVGPQDKLWLTVREDDGTQVFIYREEGRRNEGPKRLNFRMEFFWSLGNNVNHIPTKDGVLCIPPSACPVELRIRQDDEGDGYHED
jgi:hypothetical protein